jgi:hypothetical protein
MARPFIGIDAMTALKILPAVGLAVGAALFHYSQEGIHLASVGSFVLIIASVAGLIWAASQEDRESWEPFAEALGLQITAAVALDRNERVDLSGSFNGRPVKLRLESNTARYGLRTTYALTISMACGNPRRTRLRIVPVLPGFDVYLEALPPKLEGSWPWSSGFEVRGEPADGARRLVETVGAQRWAAMCARGRGGDSVKLSERECSFEKTSDARPSAAEARARLLLLSAIAAAAEER